MTMNLDPSSALADKFKGKRQVLESAVLGKVQGIDPYSALRALQKLNVADKYEQMQKAMAGQPNAPSIAQQTMAQAAQARAAMQAPAPQGMPPQAQAPQQGAGLAGMPLPESAMSMAGGGIVAFEEGGDTADATDDVHDPGVLTPEGQTALARALAYKEKIAKSELHPMSDEDQEAYAERERARYEKYAEPEKYYTGLADKLKEMEGARTGGLEQAKGLAALQAAAAVLQGNNLARGLGGAAAAFGTTYGKAADEARQEQRNLAKMQMELDAQRRSERLKAYSESLDAAQARAKAGLETDKYSLEKLKALMSGEAGIARASRQTPGRAPTYQIEMLNRFENEALADWYANPKNKDKQPSAYDVAKIRGAAADRLGERLKELGGETLDINRIKAQGAIRRDAETAWNHHAAITPQLMGLSPEEWERKHQEFIATYQPSGSPVLQSGFPPIK